MRHMKLPRQNRRQDHPRDQDRLGGEDAGQHVLFRQEEHTIADSNGEQ